MIPARGYGMLTFTRKNRLAAFVGPQLSVKCTLYRIVRTWCGNRAPSGSAGGPPAYFKAVDERVELRLARSLPLTLRDFSPCRSCRGDGVWEGRAPSRPPSDGRMAGCPVVPMVDDLMKSPHEESTN